jgi:hypothetical protein
VPLFDFLSYNPAPDERHRRLAQRAARRCGRHGPRSARNDAVERWRAHCTTVANLTVANLIEGLLRMAGYEGSGESSPSAACTSR